MSMFRNTPMVIIEWNKPWLSYDELVIVKSFEIWHSKYYGIICSYIHETAKISIGTNDSLENWGKIYLKELNMPHDTESVNELIRSILQQLAAKSL